eukprot:snap_masked-scaffold_14-processed-gene-11.10-mRNA-1 protein AED:1.00 eAED:1.00 QI:0/0/0/0/1/1/2/0/646
MEMGTVNLIPLNQGFLDMAEYLSTYNSEAHLQKLVNEVTELAPVILRKNNFWQKNRRTREFLQDTVSSRLKVRLNKINKLRYGKAHTIHKENFSDLKNLEQQKKIPSLSNRYKRSLQDKENLLYLVQRIEALENVLEEKERKAKASRSSQGTQCSIRAEQKDYHLLVDFPESETIIQPSSLLQLASFAQELEQKFLVYKINQLSNSEKQRVRNKVIHQTFSSLKNLVDSLSTHLREETRTCNTKDTLEEFQKSLMKRKAASRKLNRYFKQQLKRRGIYSVHMETTEVFGVVKDIVRTEKLGGFAEVKQKMDEDFVMKTEVVVKDLFLLKCFKNFQGQVKENKQLKEEVIRKMKLHSRGRRSVPFRMWIAYVKDKVDERKTNEVLLNAYQRRVVRLRKLRVFLYWQHKTRFIRIQGSLPRLSLLNLIEKQEKALLSLENNNETTEDQIKLLESDLEATKEVCCRLRKNLVQAIIAVSELEVEKDLMKSNFVSMQCMFESVRLAHPSSIEKIEAEVMHEMSEAERKQYQALQETMRNLKATVGLNSKRNEAIKTHIEVEIRNVAVNTDPLDANKPVVPQHVKKIIQLLRDQDERKLEMVLDLVQNLAKTDFKFHQPLDTAVFSAKRPTLTWDAVSRFIHEKYKLGKLS